MKYKTSNKQSSYGQRPHIRKGYYPAKLVSVEPYKDSDGNIKDCRYGQQLILTFAIYKSNPENGAPVEQMTYKQSKDNDIETPLNLPKFVYYQYKNTNKKTNETTLDTAFTPNSAITKTFKALGWEFSEEIDPEDYIGNWVEVNVDDYERNDNDVKYLASSIKDISVYSGPKLDEAKEEVAKEKPVEEPAKKVSEAEQSIIDKMDSMTKMHAEGNLTKEGLDKAIEQLQSELEGIKK